MTKYEAVINELYRCHREMGPEYESLRKKSKSDLPNILRNTHPDRRNGREDLRPEFEKAVDELRRRNRSDGLGKTTRCNRCEVKRQMAEQYLSNVEKALQSVAEPLEPKDFVYSIHYNPCYRNVLKADADRYKDGDLLLFCDIRRLSHL